MTGRQIFARNSRIIKILVQIVSFLPKGLRIILFRSCRNITGKKGIAIRYVLFKNIVKTCGENVVIRESVILENLQNLSLGNNVSIHPFCYIEAGGAGIKIGNNVAIAHNTSILSVNHTWEDLSTPIKYNEIETEEVTIEDDIWIGCGVRIMSGVHIGSRSVGAAGSVVTKDVQSHTLVAGVPAKVIKSLP